MALSADLAFTVGDIVTRALREASIIATVKTPDSTKFALGLQQYNLLVKRLEGKGRHSWAQEEAVLPLISGQNKYLLGPTGAKCGIADTFVHTTLSSALLGGETQIPLTSTEGMLGAPNILTTDVTNSTSNWAAVNSATLSVSSGLVITNVGGTAGGAQYTLTVTPNTPYRVTAGYTVGTSTSCVLSVIEGLTTLATTTLSSNGDAVLEFTPVGSTVTFQAQNTSTTVGHTSTVSSLNYQDETAGDDIGIELTNGTREWQKILTVDSSTQVTLVDSIAGSASSGLSVFSFEEQINRPIRVTNLRYSDSITASDIPTLAWNRDQYFEQPDKTTTGSVVAWHHDEQLDNGVLYVWMTPALVKNVCRFTYLRPLKVASSTNDAPDFPDTWLDWVVALLADRMINLFGIKGEKREEIKLSAQQAMEEIDAFDQGYYDMQVEPDGY